MRVLCLAISILLSYGARTESLATPLSWETAGTLGAGQVFVVAGDTLERDTADQVRRAGLLVVDLSDEWAPFLFSESDGAGGKAKPNPYRATFIALANDRASPDEMFLQSPAGRSAVLGTVPAALRSEVPGELSAEEERALARAHRGLGETRTPNFLEVYGIPPTLTVLAKRIAEDASKETCYAAVDAEGIRLVDFEIGYQTHDQARRDFAEATDDAAWAAEKVSSLGPLEERTLEMLEVYPRLQARLDRYRRNAKRLRAVRAVQARLECEGLLAAASRYTPGAFDLATHRALAEWERKNDIFGWGFVSGETQSALQRPPMELHLETFRRILAERVSDAAGIIEDGSVSRGEAPATYVSETGETLTVPNLIDDFVTEITRAMGIETAERLASFLGLLGPAGFANLRVAFQPPPLPAYYANVMDLAAEIDRGDIWYDPPFDSRGAPVAQRRRRYPAFTLFVNWNGQKIPLVRWRTTIGSWRSELGSDGQVYLKYKNSDVGPRIWRNIVAAPVWVPPDSTPGKDLLAKKVFDRRDGPVTVVNTEVMGPGFASAFGLAMAIHLEELSEGRLFDNKIRTHGSVDYTSIARRFSHGCHRLVNNRAVRLFDFVLKHRKFRRLGDQRLTDFKRKFKHDGRRYSYELTTRGYSYELRPPVPITVHEGRILGRFQEPIVRHIRKPGVAYGPLPADSPIEAVPVVGP
ncbi:MAG: hypothetical protein ACREQQ_18445 [Candidatus Binatia bacterium]